jgi:predicted DNA binding CopG/RHH family protein
MRDDIIRLRVSQEEKAIVKQEAKKTGLSISSFIRFLINNWNNRRG